MISRKVEKRTYKIICPNYNCRQKRFKFNVIFYSYPFDRYLKN